MLTGLSTLLVHLTSMAWRKSSQGRIWKLADSTRTYSSHLKDSQALWLFPSTCYSSSPPVPNFAGKHFDSRSSCFAVWVTQMWTNLPADIFATFRRNSEENWTSIFPKLIDDIGSALAVFWSIRAILNMKETIKFDSFILNLTSTIKSFFTDYLDYSLKYEYRSEEPGSEITRLQGGHFGFILQWKEHSLRRRWSSGRRINIPRSPIMEYDALEMLLRLSPPLGVARIIASALDANSKRATHSRRFADFSTAMLLPYIIW